MHKSSLDKKSSITTTIYLLRILKGGSISEGILTLLFNLNLAKLKKLRVMVWHIFLKVVTKLKISYKMKPPLTKYNFRPHHTKLIVKTKWVKKYLRGLT